MLSTIVNSRLVKTFIFGAMLITAMQEVIEQVDEIGAHHGIAVFAVFQLLKILSEFYEAAEIIYNE